MSNVFENDINEAFTEYMLTGNGAKLLETIRRCGQYGMPIAPPIYQEFLACLEKYSSGEARTLDEAFSVSRPKGWSQSAKKLASKQIGVEKISRAGSVILETQNRRLAGEAIDMELFDSIGTKFGISGSTARKYWREFSSKKLKGKNL